MKRACEKCAIKGIRGPFQVHPWVSQAYFWAIWGLPGGWGHISGTFGTYPGGRRGISCPGLEAYFGPFGASLRDCGAILSPFGQSVAYFCALSGLWSLFLGTSFLTKAINWYIGAFLKGCEAIVGLSRGLLAYVWAIYGLSGCQRPVHWLFRGQRPT